MRLRRIHMVVIITLLAFVSAFLSRLDFILGSRTTLGQVIKLRTWYYYGSFTAPIVVFKAGEKAIVFEGEPELDYKPGDVVSIIYKKADPQNARIKTLAGFWLTPFIWCLIPIIVAIAFFYSYFGKDDIFHLRFHKKSRVLNPALEKNIPGNHYLKDSGAGEDNRLNNS